MDRTQHVEWTKARAIAELDAGSPTLATASVASDLSKHPQTADHSAIELMMMLAMNGHMTTVAEVRDFIEGIR